MSKHKSDKTITNTVNIDDVNVIILLHMKSTHHQFSLWADGLNDHFSRSSDPYFME